MPGLQLWWHKLQQYFKMFFPFLPRPDCSARVSGSIVWTPVTVWFLCLKETGKIFIRPTSIFATVSLMNPSDSAGPHQPHLKCVSAASDRQQRCLRPQPSPAECLLTFSGASDGSVTYQPSAHWVEKLCSFFSLGRTSASENILLPSLNEGRHTPFLGHL